MLNWDERHIVLDRNIKHSSNLSLAELFDYLRLCNRLIGNTTTTTPPNELVVINDQVELDKLEEGDEVNCIETVISVGDWNRETRTVENQRLYDLAIGVNLQGGNLLGEPHYRIPVIKSHGPKRRNLIRAVESAFRDIPCSRYLVIMPNAEEPLLIGTYIEDNQLIVTAEKYFVTTTTILDASTSKRAAQLSSIARREHARLEKLTIDFYEKR